MHAETIESNTVPKRRAYGSRRMSADAQKWRAANDSYAGLGNAASAPHQLLAVVKQAAPALGLCGTDERLIDKLFQYTRPIDWQLPSRPVVSVSNEVLMADLALSCSAVKRAIKRLQDAGLVVMKDSPTGQRYFKRDRTGAIVADKSFGFDLSILAVRYGELRQIADEHKSERLAKREARRRITIALRMLQQCIETAEEEGLWTTWWEQTEAGVGEIKSEIALCATPTSLASLASQLEALAAQASEMLKQALNWPSIEPHMHPTGRVDATLNNYTDGFNDFVSARQGISSRGKDSPKRQAPPQAETLPDPKISAAEIAVLVPEIGTLAPKNPSWGDLSTACEQIRARLEVGHRLWNRAAEVLGPQRRIVAFADMLTYPDSHFEKGRGAYFAGMIKLAEAGRLNLGSSLYGMRQRGGLAKPIAAAILNAEAPKTGTSFAKALTRIQSRTKPLD